MFDIGWGEFLVIGIVALIAIGPKELPGVLRSIGQWTGKIRRMASDFQDQFKEAMREAEFSDLQKHADDLNKSVTFENTFNPLETVRQEIKGAMADKSAAPPAASPAIPTQTVSTEAILPAADIPVAPPEPMPQVAQRDFVPLRDEPQAGAPDAAKAMTAAHTPRTDDPA